MLVLTRKNGEAIQVGNELVIHVVSVRGDKVQLGFEAPKRVKILRVELTHDQEAGREPEKVA